MSNKLKEHKEGNKII